MRPDCSERIHEDLVIAWEIPDHAARTEYDAASDTLINTLML